ncbi:unnamed protein product [Prorocentrum cordatum]|uniref:PPIase cyclophilin-type domain-containing protein n=1 Tax=Prorocentrum cordatum TaxID=2364126 RepID=A0ABN9WRQ0_9DINO|nr:unnamed protein product [Polarella glacialis]
MTSAIETDGDVARRACATGKKGPGDRLPSSGPPSAMPHIVGLGAAYAAVDARDSSSASRRWTSVGASAAGAAATLKVMATKPKPTSRDGRRRGGDKERKLTTKDGGLRELLLVLPCRPVNLEEASPVVKQMQEEGKAFAENAQNLRSKVAKMREAAKSPVFAAMVEALALQEIGKVNRVALEAWATRMVGDPPDYVKLCRLENCYQEGQTKVVLSVSDQGKEDILVPSRGAPGVLRGGPRCGARRGPGRAPAAADVLAASADAGPRIGGHVMNMTTGCGIIRLKMRPDAAPITCDYITRAVEEGLYDGKTFYRSDFVIQCGLHGSNTKPPGDISKNETKQGEFVSNTRGTCSIAHWDVPDNGNTEFFINLQANTHLDDVYGVGRWRVLRVRRGGGRRFVCDGGQDRGRGEE